MKTIKLLSIALLGLSIGMSIVSCGDDKDDTTTQQGNNQPTGGDPNNTTTMTMSEQKSYLEQTAREFMNKVKASDFQQLSDLVEYALKTYANNNRHHDYNYSGDKYDTSVIEDWFEQCVNACNVGAASNREQRRLFIAANFTGLFEATSTGWQKTGQAAYLQFTFNDKQGRSCVLKAIASDTYTPLHLSLLDTEDYHYDYNYYQRITDMRYENVIGAPTKLQVTLTQAGSTLCDVTVNTQLTMRSEEVDLSTDAYSVTTDAKVCGYHVVVSKAQFQGDNNISVETTISKGNERLVYATATANGKVRLKNGENFEVREAGQATAWVDVLGKVQVQGNITNIDRIKDYLDEAHDARYDENRFKSSLQQANNLIDGKVFYNGSSASSAKVQLTASAYRNYYNEMKWEYTPALFFNDGTSYSFEAFFDEQTFNQVRRNFETLLDDFEDILPDIDL